MGYLWDKIFSAIDADYVPLRTFTSEPGEFKQGDRVYVKREGLFGWRRQKYDPMQVVNTVRRYQRDGNHYDRGYARRVDSIRGCTCGRPGCSG